MPNNVLESTRTLVEKPRRVFINPTRIEEVARDLSEEELTIPTWESPVCLDSSHSPEEVIDYFSLINTINFAFTDFETKQKFTTNYLGENWRGSTGMEACLKRAHDEGRPILEGEFLKSIEESEMREIFSGNMTIPLFEERLAIFREVGNVLCDKYRGHFHNLVAQSGGRLFGGGRGMIDRLVQDFPSFNDSVDYLGQRVNFYKRAQLTAGMLHGRFQNTPYFNMEDIDQLTIFADYVLPKGLRDMGVLEYCPPLAKQVDSQRIIPEGSKEELEIRAATIHAADRIMKTINQIRNGQNKVNAIHLDARLWFESRDPKGTPHHLTPTIAY
jgi:hypothetical protein